jgi:hypothetical protein
LDTTCIGIDSLQYHFIDIDRLPLNELVDTIYDYFRGTRFVDEIVFVDVPSQGNERSVERAMIREKLPNTVPVTLEKKIGDKRQMQRELREAREDMSRVPDDPHHYRIQLLNNPSREYVCLPAQMRRGRQALSKQTFKKFIKEVATKEKWIGSPWQVKPNLVVRYNLPTDPPPDQGLPRYKDDLEPKRRKNADLYECPIEDTELFAKSFARKEDPENPIPEFRPEPQYDFGTIAPENVFSLLKVYNYLYINATPLRLYPFIFDDFLQALNCQDPNSNCVLICEIFGALLKFACPEFQSKFEPGTGLNPYYKPLPQKLEDGTWSKLSEESAYIENIMTLYNQLSLNEKVAVDQWFKWRPGQWGEPPKKKKSKNNASTFVTSVRNLKAWQVALYGIIRDWYDVPDSDKSKKWRMLSTLLNPSDSLNGESNGHNDVEMESVVESTIADESNQASVEASFEQNDQDDELEIPIESEDELEYSPPASTKKKKRKVEYDSEEDELEWSDEEEKVTKKSSTRTSSTRSSLPTTPAKKATPAKPSSKSKSKSKSTPKSKAKDTGMDFGELCERMEQNFWKLNANERIELLVFLVEECVLEAEPIRQFQDEHIERTTEYKKEQRDIARQRKQIATQIALIDKASGNISQDPVTTVEVETSNGPNDSDSDGEFTEARPRRTRQSMSKKLQQELAKKKLEQLNIPLNETEDQKKLREEKQTLEDQDRALERRLNILDYQIRVSQSVCRIKPLGRDRYCNKFWWFDGALGALSLDTVAKIRDVPEQEDPFIPNNFAYGLLFVEEFSNFNGPFPAGIYQPQSELRLGLLDGKWGYYSKPEQVFED